MRTTLSTILVLLVSLVSCKKNLPDLPKDPFDYSVSVIHDDTIASNDFIRFRADIKLLSGDPSNEPITVSFEGLPANVFLGNNTSQFKANYSFSDSFGAHNAAKGTYPMKVVFTNATTGTRKYDFNLVVTDPVNRVNNFIGYYYPSGNCGYKIYVSCTMDSVAGNPGQLRIIDRTSDSYNHYGTFDTTYAIVDCCTNTFIIPSQNVQGTTVSGSGYILANSYKKIILQRHFSNDSLNYDCTVTFGN